MKTSNGKMETSALHLAQHRWDLTISIYLYTHRLPQFSLIRQIGRRANATTPFSDDKNPASYGAIPSHDRQRVVGTANKRRICAANGVLSTGIRVISVQRIRAYTRAQERICARESL